MSITTTTMPNTMASQTNTSSRKVRRMLMGITTTGADNYVSVLHQMNHLGAALDLTDFDRSILANYDGSPESMRDFRLSLLAEADERTAKANARRLAKPPKIKKGKKVRKPKK